MQQISYIFHLALSQILSVRITKPKNVLPPGPPEGLRRSRRSCVEAIGSDYLLDRFQDLWWECITDTSQQINMWLGFEVTRIPLHGIPR